MDHEITQQDFSWPSFAWDSSSGELELEDSPSEFAFECDGTLLPLLDAVILRIS